MKKLRRITLWLILLFSGAVAFGAYFIMFTPHGSSATVKFILSRFVEDGEFDYKGFEGSFARGISFENITLENLKYLPEGSIVKTHKLDISFSLTDLPGLKIDLHNGRVRIPGMHLILFNGSFEDGELDFNLFTEKLFLRETLELIPEPDLHDIEGLLRDVDIFIKGGIFQPEISGTLKIERIRRDTFTFTDSLLEFDLRPTDLTSTPRLFGMVFIEKGTLSVPRAARIDLTEGRIFFSGDPMNPHLNIRAVSQVERTRINILLRGLLENPDLDLRSDPPMSQERLLLMLATNRSWRGTEAALAEREITGEVAREFLDFFFFAGTGGRLSNILASSGLVLQYDRDVLGIGLERDIIDGTSVRYMVGRHDRGNDEESPLVQRFGLDHRLTENTSLGLQLTLDREKQLYEEKDKTDSKAFLEFRYRF